MCPAPQRSATGAWSARDTNERAKHRHAQDPCAAGANLNWLGIREPAKYGKTTATELDGMIVARMHGSAAARSRSSTATSKAKPSTRCTKRIGAAWTQS